MNTMKCEDDDVVAEVSTAASSSEIPAVRMRELTKTFRRRNGTTVQAIDHVDLDVARGEFVVLLGPSGCGKTTMLRCVAGLEHATSGRIEIRGNAVFDGERRLDLPPEHRQLSMIFQSYAVWPHLTVQQNVAFPLKSRGVKRYEARQRSITAMQMVGIENLAKQYPAQLSGGQQQRVALARALVAGDDLVLFDEPLSNVDAKVREQLRVEIAAMQRDLGFAALYVTHDQDEALELADRVVVLGEGRILQEGPPSEVYQQPRSVEVAEFVGSINLVAGTVVSSHEGTARIATPFGVLQVPSDEELTEAASITLSFRPEHATITVSDEQNEATGVVLAAMFRGQLRDYLVRVSGQTVRVTASGTSSTEIGDHVTIEIDERFVRVLSE